MNRPGWMKTATRGMCRVVVGAVMSACWMPAAFGASAVGDPPIPAMPAAATADPFSAPTGGNIGITLDRMAHASEILDRIHERRWSYREVGVTVRYSTYSLAKGQSSSNALRIALQRYRALFDRLLGL